MEPTEWTVEGKGKYSAERHGLKLDVWHDEVWRYWRWKVTDAEGRIATNDKPTMKAAQEMAETWADAIHARVV